MLVKLGIISPIFGVNIRKIFELPPPSIYIYIYRSSHGSVMGTSVPGFLEKKFAIQLDEALELLIFLKIILLWEVRRFGTWNSSPIMTCRKNDSEKKKKDPRVDVICNGIKTSPFFCCDSHLTCKKIAKHAPTSFFKAGDRFLVILGAKLMDWNPYCSNHLRSDQNLGYLLYIGAKLSRYIDTIDDESV